MACSYVGGIGACTVGFGIGGFGIGGENVVVRAIGVAIGTGVRGDNDSCKTFAMGGLSAGVGGAFSNSICSRRANSISNRSRSARSLDSASARSSSSDDNCIASRTSSSPVVLIGDNWSAGSSDLRNASAISLSIGLVRLVASVEICRPELLLLLLVEIRESIGACCCFELPARNSGWRGAIGVGGEVGEGFSERPGVDKECSVTGEFELGDLP
jgi:hypothetical protein